MIEIPESLVLAGQLNQVLADRTVTRIIPWQHPHKLAFIYKDPGTYASLFRGKPFTGASGFGSWVEMVFDNVILAVSEGTSLFYTRDENALPKKHQMLLQFDDGSFLIAQVKMYGAVVGAPAGEYNNHYYLVAREKPAVFSADFTDSYFLSLICDESLQNLSFKAFLATGQRIPGLGNGVLQDILFNSRLHPRHKVKDTTSSQREQLYQTLIATLKEMRDRGGRDTERDLFGKSGGYTTRMSKNTVKQPCDVCGNRIEKASYMGGSIYFCSSCQPLSEKR